jgi:hypothetical protein
LLFNLRLEYAIRTFEANQEDLELNGRDQLLVYASDVNILRGSIHNIKKNRALIAVSKEIGLEVNAEKTKYIGSCLKTSMQENKSQREAR